MKIQNDHVKLGKEMADSVQWQDCEYGAPEIDPKRPYGNSDVEGDIAHILGWKVNDDGLTETQSEKAFALHREMTEVIKYALKNLHKLQ